MNENVANDNIEQPTRKVLTFISRKSPYGQNYAKACLDMVLSASVFDQQVNYVFMDDGVWQLRRGQEPAAIDSKNLSAAFSALSLYEVENVYVDAQSLQDRGLAAEDLVIDATPCTAGHIASLMRQSDVVFNL
ncbi:MAG: sulfurtransferase complex subunit TusC [Gammaproteobacteria bacterium]|nr:sulfurtransferase complex subunit TusC [Gammaproteobacteria bacterium]MDP2141182.1 sulfurtransferase complex subunit TusC [Gammaproteobacteria bacterium]MDP2349144.1 sulfurtransferase complex subunit TusC [Gammaproteobacteria bacterium]